MNKQKITISHGGGGRHTRDLIQNHFAKAFSNPFLEQMDDSAILEMGTGGGRFAFTTDSYVVKPVFFPGGNIGELAVFGTVNDLAVSGAKPLFLSAGFIIEEGFLIEDLDRIIDSMKKAAEKAGVLIVTGDTKVVEKGGADGVFINTSGVGAFPENRMEPEEVKQGDKIIVNGTMGDHGIAVMIARNEIKLQSRLESDTAPLNLLIMPLLEKFPGKIKFMRDITRGGLAMVLNEFCENRSYGVRILEKNIPINENVGAICEILGLDPLYTANEGKVMLVVDGDSAEAILNIMKTLPYGDNSAIIGELTQTGNSRVILKTKIGTGRIIDMPSGEQLPRIC
ncbi:MAG: hydrogenase expression/formation protein HypE [Firmicutes bacterium]|nr:hydrogenase expression/formation protein HypE [Bacillota bacterium]